MAGILLNTFSNHTRFEEEINNININKFLYFVSY